MIVTPMTLPRLDNVPGALFSGDTGEFAHALALALMRGRTITAEDAARVDAGTTDHDIAEETISRVWRSVVEGHRYFDWHLSITEHRPHTQAQRRARFLIGTNDGPGSAPHLSLEPGIMRLEGIADGLGQTVLAVLFEACHYYLPTICTPHMSLDIAEFMYWNGYENESAMMADMRELYEGSDGTVDDESLIRKHDIPRRAEFFQDCPDWIFRPKQCLSIDNIRHIEKWNVFAACVIEACDEIHTIITDGGPFARTDCSDDYGAPIDYALVLRWTTDDSTDRILDDHFEQESQGDAVDGSCSRIFDLTGNSISTWLRNMKNTGRLARAVEALLKFIATPQHDGEAQQVRIAV
ncbi:PRTRC system protein F [Burkholderia gladioli]|uniref:PRTRC system protein F n=1 Tax=Burkholderia gladioli TaxID=28095 RepID=UPI00163FC383|nr:PRTRC system protein F [Burkholderia gladioli]